MQAASVAGMEMLVNVSSCATVHKESEPMACLLMLANQHSVMLNTWQQLTLKMVR